MCIRDSSQITENQERDLIIVPTADVSCANIDTSVTTNSNTTVTAINGTNITISAAATAIIPVDTQITFLPPDSETFTVGSTAGFSDATADVPGKFKLGDEIITYTGKTATTLTGITRGVDNSESKSLAATSTISLFDSVENLGLSTRSTNSRTCKCWTRSQ